METEVNSLDVQIKFEYSKKVYTVLHVQVRQYKKDLEDAKKKLLKAE